MNATILNFVPPGPDGVEAVELDARKFWQSRMTINGQDVPPLPELQDIGELVRSLYVPS
jgi:hypothetical protein